MATQLFWVFNLNSQPNVWNILIRTRPQPGTHTVHPRAPDDNAANDSERLQARDGFRGEEEADGGGAQLRQSESAGRDRRLPTEADARQRHHRPVQVGAGQGEGGKGIRVTTQHLCILHRSFALFWLP